MKQTPLRKIEPYSKQGLEKAFKDLGLGDDAARKKFRDMTKLGEIGNIGKIPKTPTATHTTSNTQPLE